MSQKPNNLHFLALTCAAVFAVALLSVANRAAAEAQLDTAFTYEGQLLEAGTPVDDRCEFEFTLWNDRTDVARSAQIGSTLPQTVEVAEGRFSVTLDFETDVFTGEPRWLEIAVCCPLDDCTASATGFTILLPRQQLARRDYTLVPASGDLGRQRPRSAPAHGGPHGPGMVPGPPHPPSEDFIVTRVANVSGGVNEPPPPEPRDFCPIGWNIVESWSYLVHNFDAHANHGWTFYKETLCSIEVP